MTASLRLGRIAGIPVGASWSVLLIAALFAWSLASGILPGLVPGLAPSAYWFAGVVATGLFLGSLLAHEVGHAVVAQRAGLRVRSITLWMLGGVAQLEDEPASPGDDLRVAIVGPAISLGLAVGFGVAAAAVPAGAVAVAHPDEPVTGLLQRLRGGAGVAVVVAGGELVGVVTQAEIARAAGSGPGASAPRSADPAAAR